MAQANNQPAIFEFEENKLSVHLINDEPWFIAVEVCEILDIDNPSYVIKRLDDDENLTYLITRAGQKREVNLINESGLYSLILTSRKPEAKRFKKWVTSEVLPAIRKTGHYSTHQAVPLLPSKQPYKITGELSKSMDRDAILAVSTRDDFLRNHYLQKLRGYYAMIGQEMPHPALIGQFSPRDVKCVDDFFSHIRTIENEGIDLNHSTNPCILAINFNEYLLYCSRLGIKTERPAELKYQLRRSERYPLIGTESVYSCISHKPVYCWIFSTSTQN